jgi:hypothetical protein
MACIAVVAAVLEAIVLLDGSGVDEAYVVVGIL